MTRDRNLQFRGAVSTGGSPLDFLLFLQYFCTYKSSKTSPLKSGESSEKFSGENRANPVTSVAVMIFSALTIGVAMGGVWGRVRGVGGVVFMWKMREKGKGVGWRPACKGTGKAMRTRL